MSTLYVNTITPNSGDTVTISGSLSATGKITIGDSSTDSLVFNSEISSSIIPDVDNTYNLGSDSNKWKTLNAINISASGDIVMDGEISASGLTISHNISASGTISASGNISTNGIISANGVTSSYVSASSGIRSLSDVSVLGDVYVIGNMHATSNITASGTISSSGFIYAPQFIGTASTASVALGLTNSPNINVGEITAAGITASSDVNITGNVSASGYISASNVIITDDLTLGDDVNINATGRIYLNGAGGNINIYNPTTGILGLEASSKVLVSADLQATGNITASGEIRGAALIISGNADLGASVDAVHCGSLTGQKFTVKNQLQGAIADGDTSALFTVGNTSINTDSVIYGTLNGITTLIGGLSQSSLNVHVNANNSMSFCFVDGEGGETIADDTPFTASFVVF